MNLKGLKLVWTFFGILQERGLKSRSHYILSQISQGRDLALRKKEQNVIEIATNLFVCLQLCFFLLFTKLRVWNRSISYWRSSNGCPLQRTWRARDTNPQCQYCSRRSVASDSMVTSKRFGLLTLCYKTTNAYVFIKVWRIYAYIYRFLNELNYKPDWTTNIKVYLLTLVAFFHTFKQL